MATYNVHAGHNAKVPGAGGCFSEVVEDRKVCSLVISKLRSLGHTVYDCTDDAGTTSGQNLANIVAKCNAHSVDLDISIHFNAFNCSANGTEVLLYDNGTKTVCTNILNAICELGFASRGVKDGKHLYVINQTNSPAILIECCFCDSQKDAAIYSAEKMASAIVKGITGKSVSGGSAPAAKPAAAPAKPASNGEQMYRIRKSWNDAKSQIGAYKNLEGAKKACVEGYHVYDNSGKVVFSCATSQKVASQPLYRIRKSWNDIRSQLGAYSSLESAKSRCPIGYEVFDDNGKTVFKHNATQVNIVNTATEMYRIRKSWDDPKSQLGAYKSLNAAKCVCPKGYTIFDKTGKALFVSKNDIIADTVSIKTAVFRNISPLEGMSNSKFISYIGQIAAFDMKKHNILASITIAQAILESSWGQSELSLKANNLFGMKSRLSGNTWKSNWDGKIYALRSREYKNGKVEETLSDFRLYNTPEESIEDHSNYLVGAMNGNEVRYKLVGETDPRKAAQALKDGYYASAPDYVEKLCKLIDMYSLRVYDFLDDPTSDIHS